MKKIVICLMGPTATGKSDMAIDLARQLPVEIISVDSAMIYQQMDIGTAKPDKKTLEAIPHHLIDICDPRESYSVGQFCQDAAKLIEQIHHKNKIPLLVGGTMLYFHALQFGLSTLPRADSTIRKQLEHEEKTKGLAALYQELMTIDPISAKRLHQNDRQRILRALEVYKISGKPFSDFHQHKNGFLDNYHVINIALIPEDRTALKQKIQNRFLIMLDNGFLEEVKALKARQDLHENLPAIRAVGYRQAWAYLSGEIDKATFIEKTVNATAQLAKRQLTWLRSWPKVKVFFYDLPNVKQSLFDHVLNDIAQHQK